jgi:WD40 repeat protein
MAYRRAVAASDGIVRIRDERREISLAGHAGRVTACAFSSDERLVATASWDRTARVWSTETGELLATFGGHNAWVSGVAFTPDAQHVLTTAWDGGVRAFTALGGKKEADWTMSAALVTGCAIMPGRRLVSAGVDNLVRVIDLDRPGTAAQMLLRGHRDEITTCVVSPDGRFIVSGSRDRTLIVWDADTGMLVTTLQGHTDWVSGASFTHDSRCLISAGWDGRIMRWDPDQDWAGRPLIVYSAVFTGCAVVDGGETAVTTSVDGTMRLWRLDDGRPLATTKIATGSPGGCIASPGGRYLAILGINDGSVSPHPARDLAGRPIMMTEGVLYTDRPEPAPLSDLDLAHLHAISISGLGRYIATEKYGGDVTTSEAIAIPGWTREA